MGELEVYTAPMPFATHRVHKKYSEGISLLEILLDICPIDIRTGIAACIMVNGNLIPASKWRTTYPKEGELINIRIVPGKGTGKTILMAVVAIAVMIAAPQIGAALGATISAGLFAGAGMASAISIGSVVGGILGAVAASSLMSMANQKPSDNNTIANNSAETTTQFIEGASNQLNPFGVVPICLGTNRMYPPQAARPYTETVDGNQYVRQLFCWGIGNQLSFTNMKIGETAIENFRGVELAHRLSGDLNQGTTLFTNDAYQDDYSVLLSSAGGAVVKAAHPNADEIVVDVTFARGLCRYDNNGNRVSTTVSVRVEIALISVGTWVSAGEYTFTAATAEALRKSMRIPTYHGNYNIRVTRLTADSTDDKTLDECYLTAVRTFTYTAPVTMDYVNGTAIRMLATDQLNGTVDQLNAVVSNLIPDYEASNNTWVTRATSNPASIYLYVLRGPGNAKPLDDDKIILDDFIAWHKWCVQRGYTYNQIIDYDTSVQDVLNDIAAAGCASPACLDGKRTIVIDQPKDNIVQIITPRNSSNYEGQLLYPDIPHALRVVFRDKNNGYATTERIVYNDGYNEDGSSGLIAATLFESYTIKSCTNSDEAYKYGRRVFARALLQPEIHKITMDIENLVAVRGDRIKAQLDVPLIGVGCARIKATAGITTEVLITDDSKEVITTESGESITAENVFYTTEFLVDDTIVIPDIDTYYIRVRKSNGVIIYKQIDLTSPGYYTSFNLVDPLLENESPEVGDLCYFFKAGGELDGIISSIEPQSDLSAVLTIINYAPEIYDAETGLIPSFNPNITVPLELRRVSAPELINIQSDESVAIVNLDGSITSRAVITLQNTNGTDVEVSVKIRHSGDTQLVPANVLEASDTKVILTGLDSGTNYDIYIYYYRAGSPIYSEPLQINSYKFIGTAGLPSDVTGFVITVSGDLAQFKWNANTDIDFNYYRIKYTPSFTGATWQNTMLIEDEIQGNRLSMPFRKGTYLIKAVDKLGGESETAALIITADLDLVSNAISVLTETSTFAGAMTNVEEVGGVLKLQSTPGIGYYVFSAPLVLGDVYNTYLSAIINATGDYISGYSGDNNVFEMDDIFNVSDLFGIEASSWGVRLEVSSSATVASGNITTESSQDITTESAVVITAESSGSGEAAWSPFISSYSLVDTLYFRLVLESYELGITPAVSSIVVNADMDDRIERAEGLTCDSSTGATITYPFDFYADPALTIQLQDGVEGDEIQFSSKTVSGFAFKVYNNISATFVTRTYDYIASGYGRKTP